MSGPIRSIYLKKRIRRRSGGIWRSGIISGGHRAEAEAYGSLKARLAEEFPYDIEGYCQGKDAFVNSWKKKALLWRKLQENRRGLKFCRLRNCRKLLKPAAEWFARKMGDC